MILTKESLDDIIRYYLKEAVSSDRIKKDFQSMADSIAAADENEEGDETETSGTGTDSAAKRETNLARQAKKAYKAIMTQRTPKLKVAAMEILANAASGKKHIGKVIMSILNVVKTREQETYKLAIANDVIKGVYIKELKKAGKPHSDSDLAV